MQARNVSYSFSNSVNMRGQLGTSCRKLSINFLCIKSYIFKKFLLIKMFHKANFFFCIGVTRPSLKVPPTLDFFFLRLRFGNDFIRNRYNIDIKISLLCSIVLFIAIVYDRSAIAFFLLLMNTPCTIAHAYSMQSRARCGFSIQHSRNASIHSITRYVKRVESDYTGRQNSYSRLILCTFPSISVHYSMFIYRRSTCHL